ERGSPDWPEGRGRGDRQRHALSRLRSFLLHDGSCVRGRGRPPRPHGAAALSDRARAPLAQLPRTRRRCGASYLERAVEGVNEADGPLSAACRWACWIASHTRRGVTGSAVMPTPRSRKASHTAFAIAPLSPGLPHSPRPRRPSGFVVAVTSW